MAPKPICVALAVIPLVTTADPFSETATAVTFAVDELTESVAAMEPVAAGVKTTPTVAGSYSGMLTASSNMVTSTLSIPVSGVGFDFTTSVSGQSSVTVTAGTSASYTMTIDAAKGVQGTYNYTYTCGTLPSNVLCTFSPTSTTATAGVEGYVSISISTGKAKAALEGGPAKWRMLPMLCGLVVLPLALRRRRKLLAMLVLLVVVTLAASSCASAGLSSSGGSGGSGSTTTTPAGTYTIPVTVTSTGVSHSVTLTLTVI